MGWESVKQKTTHRGCCCFISCCVFCACAHVWVGIECLSCVVHVCSTCPLFLNVMISLLVMHCATSSYIFVMGYGAI